MTTLTIGKLKSQFSSVLEQVKRGQEVVISYGKKKEKIAVIIPYRRYRSSKQPRKLGLLKGKAKCVITPDFALTDEEFLSS